MDKYDVPDHVDSPLPKTVQSLFQDKLDAF